jgi:hypothetical protein
VVTPVLPNLFAESAYSKPSRHSSRGVNGRREAVGVEILLIGFNSISRDVTLRCGQIQSADADNLRKIFSSRLSRASSWAFARTGAESTAEDKTCDRLDFRFPGPAPYGPRPPSLPDHTRFWIAGGIQYDTGLPFEFDGDPADALVQYGQQVMARLNFARKASIRRSRSTRPRARLSTGRIV